MHGERLTSTRQTNGAPALGEVARDTIDHASMLLRDEVKIARLEARRYADHVRREVAPRALWWVAAAATGALAVLFALIAVFLGIAAAIGSVAWAFAIYAGAFVVGAIAAAGLANRPRELTTGEAIAQSFPATRMRPSMREHAMVQHESKEAHREVVAEAQREAKGP